MLAPDCRKHSPYEVSSLRHISINRVVRRDIGIMSRKNLYEVLEQREINVEEEMNRLFAQLYEETDTPIGSVSIVGNIDDDFVNLIREYHISADCFRDLLSDCGLNQSNNGEVHRIDDLFLLIEIITMCINSETFQVYALTNQLENIKARINNIMEKTHHKIVDISNSKVKKLIVISNDECIDQAAELVYSDDPDLALSILGYSHYSEKNNLVAKREILLKVANYLEPRLKREHGNNRKDLTPRDILYAFNNFSIRHNSSNQISASDAEMNDLYDMLYREILWYILLPEHKKFSEKVNKLKGNDKLKREKN